MKVLLLDNYDSFTYMLKDYIEQCGVVCDVKRNDDVNVVEAINRYDVLVISPGPQTPMDAGRLMESLQRYAFEKPILGVCLGHQGIGMFFGARLIKALKPKHGKIDMLTHTAHPLFANIPHRFEATRYHSLILDSLPPELEIIASSADGEIMGIAHKSLPLWGIQFHPESCATGFGLQLIQNFLNLAQQNA
jgi:anthranilate synthase component 2